MLKRGIFKISLPAITGLVLVLSAVLNFSPSALGSSATPSVTPSPSVSPTPSVSPSPSVLPSPAPPIFPHCEDQNGRGDKSHYDSGSHWIVGDGLVFGRDDVYSLGNQNYMQCFCPPTDQYVPGNEGIQTNWENAHTVNKPADRSGFFLVWGPDFGLDQSWFYATGADMPSPKTPNFDCGQPQSSPSPTVSPSPSITPSTGGSSDNNKNVSSGSSNNNSSGSSSNNNPQVLGVTTLAATGTSSNLLIFALGFASIAVGLWQIQKLTSRRIR